MSAAIGTVFKPGQICPQSGIYRVVHDSQHREKHDVTCVNGKRFPPCNHCGDNVRFVLKYPAHHVDRHPAFSR